MPEVQNAYDILSPVKREKVQRWLVDVKVPFDKLETRLNRRSFNGWQLSAMNNEVDVATLIWIRMEDKTWINDVEDVECPITDTPS